MRKDRYLDIELILEDESGLKIPKSSVTKKDFYLVPENYLTQGGNSKETGVLTITILTMPSLKKLMSIIEIQKLAWFIWIQMHLIKIQL